MKLTEKEIAYLSLLVVLALRMAVGFSFDALDLLLIGFD